MQRLHFRWQSSDKRTNDRSELIMIGYTELIMYFVTFLWVYYVNICNKLYCNAIHTEKEIINYTI